MGNPLIIRKDSIRKLFIYRLPAKMDLLVVEKRTVARWLFYLGILIAFYGTLNPWFVWPISRFVNYLASVPVVLGMMYSYNLRQGLFNRQDFFLPFVACLVLQLVMALTSGHNVNGIIVVAFSSMVYLSVMRVDIVELRKLGDLLTKTLACILVVSIPFYFLYLAGFPLPHSHIVPEDWEYSFENYYFFLIDDRFAFELIPRFHSVFLEPSHMGMACVALLYAQIGKWNKWRCRLLFFAIVISFSLAAYLCLIVLLFSAAWMKGKAILGKIVLLLTLCTTVVVGSIFYNKGENLVNILIVQRLTTNDEGDLEGDNRTSELFTKEYDKMIDSGQFFVGKGMEGMERFGSSGNSGYRVYLYTYGLVTVFFLLVFFFLLLRTSDNTRAKVSMLIIQGLSFVAHGIPLKYYFFIPLYILLFSEVYPVKEPKKKRKEVSL